jgi:hypothetical protein
MIALINNIAFFTHSIILWKSVIITSSTFTSVFHSDVNISTVWWQRQYCYLRLLDFA